MDKAFCIRRYPASSWPRSVALSFDGSVRRSLEMSESSLKMSSPAGPKASCPGMLTATLTPRAIVRVELPASPR